jgi:hypothetical protein
MFKIKKRARINYWSCSSFANWIRAIDKPHALPWDEWVNWRATSEKKHPYRYWMAEEGLDFLQDIVNFPMDVYHTIEIYIRNRFIDKLHYLRTGLKPGEYYDPDYRILHGLFNELVIFVESEQAHLMKAYPERKYKFVKGRCKQAGLDYLDWACNLKMNEDYGINPGDEDYNKPTAQAISSQKILELYNWWLDRDYRVDPHDLFNKEKDGKYYYRKIGEMEDNYDKEDTEKLIELIQIRSSLWT